MDGQAFFKLFNRVSRTLITFFMLITSLIDITTSDQVALSPSDPSVLANATYALNELIKISDSGVYSSLRLGKITSAIIDDGMFHDNMILNVQLESPYFKSGRSPIESYRT